MSNEKKSFIVHLDGCRAVKALGEAEQIGWLFLLLIDYAERCVKNPEVKVEECLADFPQLKQGAAIASYYLCDNIQRDTLKWRQRQETCARAAKARYEKEDNQARKEELRRYLQGMDQERKEPS